MENSGVISVTDNGEILELEVLKTMMAEKHLDHFVKQAWRQIEPETNLIWGWHLDAICDHLEAVTKGDILRLIINIPPRHTKSLSVSVCWPAWSWIDRPGIKWLFSSYAIALSIRDSGKCRRLIQSPWYQSRWNDRFSIVRDQNQKIRFENDHGGYRIATSVEGSNTGEGGDCLVVDDPHNVMESESDTVRASTLMWWDEVMSTRANDPKRSARVIIMQRSHENDLTGHILEKEGIDYVHLCLPARYEPSRLLTKTPLDFKDPRTEEGEPLCPDRYGDEELTNLEAELGEYAAAGQLQQRPHPRGGGMFKIDNFVLIDSINKSEILASVRYWDKAASEGDMQDKNTKRTAGVLMHKMRDKSYVIEDVINGKWPAGLRERLIKQTAQLDGKRVNIWVEQEPGSGGKESAETTIRNLAGYVCRADRVTGEKEVRAEQYSAQVAGHNVYILNRNWTRSFIREHESFPVGKFTDQVDAASGAFNKLHGVLRAGTWGRKREK